MALKKSGRKKTKQSEEEKKSAVSEAEEEDPRAHSAFQTGQISRFSERRWQARMVAGELQPRVTEAGGADHPLQDLGPYPEISARLDLVERLRLKRRYRTVKIDLMLDHATTVAVELSENKDNSSSCRVRDLLARFWRARSFRGPRRARFNIQFEFDPAQLALLVGVLRVAAQPSQYRRVRRKQIFPPTGRAHARIVRLDNRLMHGEVPLRVHVGGYGINSIGHGPEDRSVSLFERSQENPKKL